LRWISAVSRKNLCTLVAEFPSRGVLRGYFSLDLCTLIKEYGFLEPTFPGSLRVSRCPEFESLFLHQPMQNIVR